jgi:hypothetical protein
MEIENISTYFNVFQHISMYLKFYELSKYNIND